MITNSITKLFAVRSYFIGCVTGLKNTPCIKKIYLHLGIYASKFYAYTKYFKTVYFLKSKKKKLSLYNSPARKIKCSISCRKYWRKRKSKVLANYLSNKEKYFLFLPSCMLTELFLTHQVENEIFKEEYTFPWGWGTS